MNMFINIFIKKLVNVNPCYDPVRSRPVRCGAGYPPKMQKASAYCSLYDKSLRSERFHTVRDAAVATTHGAWSVVQPYGGTGVGGWCGCFDFEASLRYQAGQMG